MSPLEKRSVFQVDRNAISQIYGFDLSMYVNEIRDKYGWNGIDGSGLSGAICQGCIPQAIGAISNAYPLEAIATQLLASQVE